jgi:hypothetical protein
VAVQVSPPEAHINAIIEACRLSLGIGEDIAAAQFGAKVSHGLIAAARDYGLTAPLYKAVQHSLTVSADLLLSIHEISTEVAVRNLQLTSAVLEVLDILRANQIEALVVKGAALGLLAFRQVTAREFTDIDLLIPPHKIKQAEHVLSCLGYTRIGSYEPDSRTEKHLQLLRESDEILVELHWALNPPSLRFPLETVNLWQNTQVLELAGRSFRTLSLEDTLLTLCIHAVRHGWRDLKCAYDIAGLLHRHEDAINWTTLFKRCNELGCTRVLLASVRVSCDLFGIKFPARPVQRATHEHIAECIANTICQLLRSGQSLAPRDIIALQVRVHDRLIDRVFVVVSLSVPDLPRVLPKSARPIARSPLRYLTRPVRLVNLYGFSWLRSVLLGR